MAQLSPREYFDHRAGQLVAALRSAGLDDETIWWRCYEQNIDGWDSLHPSQSISLCWTPS
jgi:hypothetical protein